jgi:hypothetical protein
VFRLHRLLKYINGDRDSKFCGAFWQELNKIAGTLLIPSTWFPPNVGIPRTSLILSPMEPRKLVGIGSGGLLIWWWDLEIHLSERLIQMMMMIEKVVTMIGLLYFWDVSRGNVKSYYIWKDRLKVDHGFTYLDFTKTPSQGRILDSGFTPFREFNLGF